jgi:hypothetical protein
MSRSGRGISCYSEEERHSGPGSIAAHDCLRGPVDILGLAAQYIAGAGLLTRETDRSAVLATVAARWTQHDPAKYRFVHQVATQLPDHDDRERFLVVLFLAGIATVP